MSYLHPFAALWLPTLLSAVAVFILSALVHMVVRWHSNDQVKLPNEDAVANALESVPAGDYRLPWADGMEHMKDPAYIAKANKAMAIVTVMRGDMMGSFRNALIQWFIYSLVVSTLAGHIAYGSHHENPEPWHIFHTVALAAWLGYGMAIAQQPIWGGKPWKPAIKSMVDSLFYAAVTGAIFVWRWPS